MAFRSVEKRESGFCFSTSGRSNSATCRTEEGKGSAQLQGCVFALLSYLTSVHDQDAICVRHGVDSVGDGEHGAVPEGFLDGVLDQSVRLCVDGRRRLVQEDNLLSGLAWKAKLHEAHHPFLRNHIEQFRRWQMKSTPSRIRITVFTGL